MTRKAEEDAKKGKNRPNKERPKIQKEKLSDLDPKDKSEGVQGGFRSAGCYS